MVKIKAWILGADGVFLSLSGYSSIDILNTYLTGNLALGGFENFLKLLLSMGGFVYLCARTYHFIINSGLERDLKREEIIAKQNENHKNTPYKQFKDSLKEDNHENLKK